MPHRIIRFESRREASECAADLAALKLEGSMEQSDRVSLMLSGGSTPGPMYAELSDKELDWGRVTVGLVDERWVEPDHPASNEKLVRESLLIGRAKNAMFVPMKTAHAEPDMAVDTVEAAYAPYCQSISCIVLGMGEDGHTASWFPGIKNLEVIMDVSRPSCVASVDASGEPVAGDCAHRMTLTARAICRAEAAILLIFGETKMSVLEHSLREHGERLPIRHVADALGDRLEIVWAA